MVSLKTFVASYGIIFGLLATSAAQPAAAHALSTRAEDFYLRIMPLGASITRGDPAEPGDEAKNGYRKHLRDKLRADGWFVNMVGSVQYGNMNDNDNEGWPGYTVAQVHEKAKKAIPLYKPNLILINAGTNDAGQTDKYPLEQAGARMEQLILSCFKLSPETVVVLSTLLPNGNNGEKVKNINRQYRALAEKLKNGGRHVALADMDDGFITIDDIWDKTHPTVEGAKKMASVWVEAIGEADEAGWLVKPSEKVHFKDEDFSTTCDKTATENSGNGRRIVRDMGSSITDDGDYKHAAEKRGNIWPGGVVPPDATVAYAKVSARDGKQGKGLDDLVLVDRSGKKILVARNNGDGDFGEPASLDMEDGCVGGATEMGDADGDGLDDLICIAPDGEMLVSLNEGGDAPTFGKIESYKAAGMGASAETVRLGDIDGDGRVDYCVVQPDGSIKCWWNAGPKNNPSEWQDMGASKPIFAEGASNDNVRFVDINGDGRDDLLLLTKMGSAKVWINQRGKAQDLIPHWLDAGDIDLGLGGIADLQNLQFGRIYGSGRADYSYHQNDKCSSNTDCDIKIDAWENKGSGGAHQKGDGTRWGDMTGTGVDDFVWISASGVVTVFPNKNTPAHTSHYEDDPWGAPVVVLETGADRRALHIGDWDGDGKADIIGVDRASGALTVWINKWYGEAFSFDKQEIDNSDKCKEGWGVGLSDYGVRFADITGEGRVDYLCLETNGRISGWLNDEASTLRDAKQVKFSEGLERSDFRLADVNGDGRADLIWTDKINGDTPRLWYNNGELPEDGRMSGSKFHWIDKGRLFGGVSRGVNMHFPSLQGQARADMVMVDPVTAEAWAWFNSCPPTKDDVPVGEPVPDPGLPEYTPKPPTTS